MCLVKIEIRYLSDLIADLYFGEAQVTPGMGSSPADLIADLYFGEAQGGKNRLRIKCISSINTHVTPFPISIQPGIPISDQIFYAAKRAILFGQMRAGDAFPSVRSLSKDLRINPNTAHRAVTELINAGLLEMHPGIGTVVATPPDATPQELARLLGRQIEELVVEARRLGVDQNELLREIAKQYESLTHNTRGQARR